MERELTKMKINENWIKIDINPNSTGIANGSKIF